MPEPRWTCHYDYPGCRSGRMCKACVNDLHLWGQIKPSLAVGGVAEAVASHPYADRMAQSTDDYSGIIIGEPPADAVVVHDDEGYRLEQVRPCVDPELCTAADRCPPCCDAGRYDRTGVLLGIHPDGSITVLRDSDRREHHVPRAEIPQWTLRRYDDEETGL